LDKAALIAELFFQVKSVAVALTNKAEIIAFTEATTITH
jgi:hypothetical protein